MIRFIVGRNGNVKSKSRKEEEKGKNDPEPSKTTTEIKSKKPLTKQKQPEKAPMWNYSSRPNSASSLNRMAVPKKSQAATKKHRPDSSDEEMTFECKTPRTVTPPAKKKNAVETSKSKPLNQSHPPPHPQVTEKPQKSNETVKVHNSNVIPVRNENAKAILIKRETQLSLSTLVNYNADILSFKYVPINQLHESLRKIVQKPVETQEEIIENISNNIKGFLQMAGHSSETVTSNPTNVTDLLLLLKDFVEFYRKREDLTVKVQELATSLTEENAIFREVIANHSPGLTHIEVVMENQAKSEDAKIPLMLDQETITDEMPENDIQKAPIENVPTPVQKELVNAETQSDPVVDEAALKYRNKIQELHQEIAKIHEKYKSEIENIHGTNQLELKQKISLIQAKESKIRELEENIQKINSEAEISNKKISDLLSKHKTFEDQQNSLENQITAQRREIRNIEDELHKAQKEKMETFKQFRALNMLYDEMKSNNEALEAKKNSVMDRLKDFEHKYGIVKAQLDDLLIKHDVTTNERDRIRGNYESLRNDMTRLQNIKLELENRYEEVLTKSKSQQKKIKQYEDSLDALMKFPDLSLGEEDYNLAITSPQFDKAIQEYIKGNNMRILLLEKKNDEYRKLRLQHANIMAKKLSNANPRNMNKDQPALLYDPAMVKETMSVLELSNDSPDIRDLKAQITYSVSELSHNKDIKPKRSALSAGKRQSLTPKSVSFNQQFS